MTAPSRRQHGRAAYTLVELVVSTTIMAILMVGIGSSLLLAAKAVDDGRDPLAQTRAAAEAVDRVAGELTYAHTISARPDKAITFMVADRDADGSDESIAYSWSGTPGDPLVRNYNSSPAVIVIDDVREFALTYTRRTGPDTSTGSTNESAETLLFSTQSGMLNADFVITDTAWLCQPIAAQLPADATEWRITRVKFQARAHGAAKGVTAVQLRLLNTWGEPETTVLGEQLMYESVLGFWYSWQQFAYTTVAGLAPTQEIGLVLARSASDAHLCDVAYDTSGSTPMLTTSNAGGSWSYTTRSTLCCLVYGTVTTTDPATVTPIEHATAVTIALRVGDETRGRIETTVELLNAPELPAP